MNALDCFKAYLAIKNHFIMKNYNYIKYKGKVKASEKAFLKRNDRIWFEKLSRQKSKKEILQFFVSNFVMSGDPQKLWIGDIIKNGQTTYTKWLKKIQTLTYTFTCDLSLLLENNTIEETLQVKNGQHSILLKAFLRNDITVETLVILNTIYDFKTKYDEILLDPIWSTISLMIEKYSVFLDINTTKYKKIIDSRA